MKKLIFLLFTIFINYSSFASMQKITVFPAKNNFKINKGELEKITKIINFNHFKIAILKYKKHKPSFRRAVGKKHVENLNTGIDTNISYADISDPSTNQVTIVPKILDSELKIKQKFYKNFRMDLQGVSERHVIINNNGNKTERKNRFSYLAIQNNGSPSSTYAGIHIDREIFENLHNGQFIRFQNCIRSLFKDNLIEESNFYMVVKI